MSGDKTDKPDPREPGWRDYKEAESVGRRDGADELEETEEQVRSDENADVDGDGTPDPAIGSSDFVSRDVETELRKDRLKDKG